MKRFYEGRFIGRKRRAGNSRKRNVLCIKNSACHDVIRTSILFAISEKTFTYRKSFNGVKSAREIQNGRHNFHLSSCNSRDQRFDDDVRAARLLRLHLSRFVLSTGRQIQEATSTEPSARDR